MGRIFQPMGRKRPQKKHNKKNTNKYSNNDNNESYVVSKKPRKIKQSSSEQIFEIADEIFGGKYYNVGNK